MNVTKGTMVLFIFILMFACAWMLNQFMILNDITEEFFVTEHSAPDRIKNGEPPQADPFLPRQYIRIIPKTEQ